MIRARNPKAVLWWALLPYAGNWAYRNEGNPTNRVVDFLLGAIAWPIVHRLPGRVFRAMEK